MTAVDSAWLNENGFLIGVRIVEEVDGGASLLYSRFGSVTCRPIPAVQLQLLAVDRDGQGRPAELKVRDGGFCYRVTLADGPLLVDD